MTTTVAFEHLQDRYTAQTGLTTLTGIQAIVRSLLERAARDRARGLRTAGLITGYEGSPLGGLDIELSRNRSLLDADDIVFTPALNEESASMAVAGTQLLQLEEGRKYDAVVGYWYGKAPGLDRATDGFRHASYFGTSEIGGAVALVGDDPAAKSSSIPSASEYALADLMIPTLVPGDPQDILDLGIHAVELSRACGLWAAVKITTPVADGSATVNLDPDRLQILQLPRDTPNRITGHMLQPTLGEVEREIMTTRIERAREYGRLNDLNSVVVSSAGDRIGIVACGKAYLDVRQALEQLGLDVEAMHSLGIRIMKVSMPFPLHPTTIREFADGLDLLVVVEEKRAFVETAIKDILYAEPNRPAVVGKADRFGNELFTAIGDLEPGKVLHGLKACLRDALPQLGWSATNEQTNVDPVLRPLPIEAVRVPYFCSGCPHNSSLVLPPEGSLLGAGIGCHTMALMMDKRRVGTMTGVTQMGGEGSQWIGMQPFLESNHYVQNIGDGTFHHSGSLAVRAALAASSNITFRLLYNSAVAMTGGQRPVGMLTVPQIVTIMLAEGVTRIIITTEDVRRYRRVRLPREVVVWDRSRIDEALRVLAEIPGVTMLIHDQECAAERRRKRKRASRSKATA